MNSVQIEKDLKEYDEKIKVKRNEDNIFLFQYDRILEQAFHFIISFRKT